MKVKTSDLVYDKPLLGGGGPGGVTDHGALTGLADDDHTQYALLAGRIGGQVLYGGTDTGNDLTLRTTSHAVKGSYFLADLTSNGFVKTSGGTGELSIDTNTYLTAVTAHDILSATHGDTLADSVIRGDVLIGNSTPKWARLAFPASPTGKVLQATATDIAWSSNPLTIGASASVSGSNTGDQDLSGYVKTDQTVGQTVGADAARLTKLWVTDITITNALAGSVTGNAGTLTVADEAADTTCFPLFATAASGSLPGKTNAGLTFNAATGLLTATGFSGPLNGTVGAGTPTTIVGTTITANTGFVPDANDGAYLGTLALAFSDLFLAEGGVINWDNGDATLTQVGDVVTLAGADLKVTTAGNVATSVITTDAVQTLSSKTLTTPTIASFLNANHTHAAAGATGGQVDHGTLGGLGDDDHTIYAALAGRAGGQTLIGGTAASNVLLLQSTSHATKGTIDLDDRIRVMPTNVTYTAAPLLMDFNNTMTLDFANATFQVLDYRSTITLKQSADMVNPSALFNVNPTIINDAALAGFFGPVAGLWSHPVYTADTKAMTHVQHVCFWSNPSFGIANAGTLSMLLCYTALSDCTVGAGVSVTSRRGFEVKDATGAGTIVTQIGISILALTKGTTNVGLKNALTTVYLPSAAQNITAVGNAILANATVVQLSANASYVLTSAPTIANGQDGQIVTIVNVDTVDTITLQDQGTLANSNLRLGANTRALAPRDNITLTYNATIGDWVEIGFVNVT